MSHTNRAAAKKAITTKTKVWKSWRSMPSSIAALASRGGASEAAVPTSKALNMPATRSR